MEEEGAPDREVWTEEMLIDFLLKLFLLAAAKIGECEKGSRGMATFNAYTLFSPNRRIL